MPLAGVVPLDAMRLILAGVELSDRQEHVIDGVVVRTVQAGAPARPPRAQAPAGGLVAPPPFPIPPPAWRTIPNPSDPQGVGLFFFVVAHPSPPPPPAPPPPLRRL